MAADAYNIKALETKIVALVERARQQVIEAHQRAGQVASGRTRDSFVVEDYSDSNGLKVCLWGRQFTQGLETGRAGGRVPQGFYGIIRQWAIDKGLRFGTDRERNTFAYFVSRKIAREGTSLYRSGGRNDIYTPAFNELIEKIDNELSDFFGGMASAMFEGVMESIPTN